MVTESESVKVLLECVELQNKKSLDYQNPNSRVKQADYYPNGINTLADICWAKMLRIISLLETMEKNKDYSPQNEPLEDSFKDLINYSSFAVAWIRGKINGQTNTKYKLVGNFKSGELSVVMNYLLNRNFNFKIEDNNVFLDTSDLDIEGFKILQNNLVIELLKY
jgi:hypothetical protein